MERLHIAFFGPVNSGKSTLVNAIAGQEVSLVSDIPGTTTDPVRKAVELPGLGACVLIDTAGLDDASELGPERERRTRAILDEADIVVMVCPAGTAECKSAALLEKADIPIVQYHRGEPVPELLQKIAAALPKEEERFLTGKLVMAGDCVLLVMPQDSEAPKGRLILPQVQVIRELLDRGCNPICCTPDSLQSALRHATPDLVITDSQVFAAVNAAIPPEMPLTSFSILLAAGKGDVSTYLEGATAIGRLAPGSRVLIAEACTHVPNTEDIGRVKIPALLRKKVGGDLQVDIAAGNDFPEDLSPYSLVIQCGGCVATERMIRSRIRKSVQAGVPITNYGIALAALTGILSRIVIP
ncbi:MAG: 50S ribosome-binding GTPase [Bacteroidales bacterium]|nr:50S ribosome-binding GTPase [Bacteroidales bacterium]